MEKKVRKWDGMVNVVLLLERDGYSKAGSTVLMQLMRLQWEAGIGKFFKTERAKLVERLGIDEKTWKRAMAHLQASGLLIRSKVRGFYCVHPSLFSWSGTTRYQKALAAFEDALALSWKEKLQEVEIRATVVVSAKSSPMAHIDLCSTGGQRCNRR